LYCIFAVTEFWKLFIGRANMLWPGLNAPVMQGQEARSYKKLPRNPDYEQEIIRLRDQSSQIRYKSLPPLLRGWSGSKFPGQSIGPPDPVGDCK